MKHASIIDQWPSLSAFAEEIGLSYEGTKAMRRRSSIPGRYWLRIEEVAQSRGLTAITLLELAKGAASVDARPQEGINHACQTHPVS